MRTPHRRRVFIRPVMITSNSQGIRVPALRLSFQIQDSRTLSLLGMRNRIFGGGKTASLVGSELTPEAIRMLSMAILSDCSLNS